MAAWAALALLTACSSGAASGGAPADAGGSGDTGSSSGSPGSHADSGEGGGSHGGDGGGAGLDGGNTDGGPHGGDGGSGPDAGSSAEDGSAAEGGGGDGSAAGPDGGANPEGGGDAGATSDPFDPASCGGAPLTEAQAAQFFQPGATQATIGTYTIEMRQRSCNPVTGCGSWGAPATGLGAVLGGGTQPLGGTIFLNVEGTTVVLALQDHTEEKPYSMGATCSTVDGTPVTCGGYSYDIGDQWGGSGGLFPTMGGLTDVNSADVLLAGVLTEQCLRLAYSALDASGNEVQQFVLLAPVSPGPPPPPDPCPGGGTQMACGSQAAGQVTCCQNGLTTCPQSGCDCWGACQ